MLTRRHAAILGAAGLLAPRAAWSGADSPAQAYERATGGRVGIYARNVRTGKTLSWRADSRFIMCSTFKASLAALVLRRVDDGADSLATPVAFGPADVAGQYAPAAAAALAKGTLSVGEMCEAAVEQSDNACANLLLDRVGGPAALTAFWRGIGDDVSRLDDPEPLLNRTPADSDRDTTTPRAMAMNFHRFVLGDALRPESRDRLKAWLVGSVTGFKRLRAGLPPGWTVGDKTGNNGNDAAGDVAVAWPAPGEAIVMCAYTRGGRPTASHLDALFAAVGRDAADMLA